MSVSDKQESNEVCVILSHSASQTGSIDHFGSAKATCVSERYQCLDQILVALWLFVWRKESTEKRMGLFTLLYEKLQVGL